MYVSGNVEEEEEKEEEEEEEQLKRHDCVENLIQSRKGKLLLIVSLTFSQAADLDQNGIEQKEFVPVSTPRKKSKVIIQTDLSKPKRRSCRLNTTT